MIHVVIFVLFLLADTQGGCPIKCNCTDNAVNCVSKNLQYVPYFESLTNNPVIIDLSGNSISLIDIDDFSFDKSDEVKEIYLNHSGLAAIEEQAFEELENLQELYLSNNLLNTLPSDFITDNENMILLDLSSNYFIEMPKIQSESLEVLTIANSGVSKISDDALEGLPNLRILLLSQNNLKTINPIIFDHMSNLFFISISFNPWYCNCKTIKLFDYLTDRKFVDLTETVQCQRGDKIFVDIYTDKGVVDAFKQQCTLENTLDIQSTTETVKELEIDQTVTNKKTVEETNSEYFYNYFQNILILAITVLVSWIVGAVSGSYITFKYMSRNIKQTESTKELLTKVEENIAAYNSL